eukprot:2604272-Pyramimonas_sp.AAC.1
MGALTYATKPRPTHPSPSSPNEKKTLSSVTTTGEIVSAEHALFSAQARAPIAAPVSQQGEMAQTARQTEVSTEEEEEAVDVEGR